MLDLGLYVEEGRVRSSLFQKHMANPYMIMYKSAIPVRTKRDSLLQEGMRRIRNMGPDAPDLERILVLGRMMNAMRSSGYDWMYRTIF